MSVCTKPREFMTDAEVIGCLEEQILLLANVLMDEFGGPVMDESACEMAIRVLREQRKRIDEMQRSRVPGPPDPPRVANRPKEFA